MPQLPFFLNSPAQPSTNGDAEIAAVNFLATVIYRAAPTWIVIC
jgi:hypothetical protein